MNKTHTIEIERKNSQSIEKLYLENTLLRLSGALFCHDRKRARNNKKLIEINKGIVDKYIAIRPDAEYGQPGRLAHKLFVAIIKKHSDYGRPIKAEVTFSKRELMRLIGRKQWGGSASEQIHRALNEIHYTFIKTSFKSVKGSLVEHSFNIFPEIFLERAEFASDPIETCAVTIARPILSSLADEHFICLNHPLMQRLETIGQALYMRLFFHFSNLYDGHQKNQLTFAKKYDDICVEWLGGLIVLPTQSQIQRDQLGPHLRQLVAEGFLTSFTIQKASSGEGLVLSFKPGKTFFSDYDRFYRKRSIGPIRWTEDADSSNTAEPMKFAYLFEQKRTGQKLREVPYVSSKEVRTAKLLLARLSPDDGSSFLDFALSQAKKTKFNIQTLGGVRQYLEPYLQAKEGAIHQKERARVAQEDALLSEYQKFQRSRVNDLLAGLSAKEKQELQREAEKSFPNFSSRQGGLAETMLKIEISRIVTKRYPNKVMSFPDWKAKRLAN